MRPILVRCVDAGAFDAAEARILELIGREFARASAIPADLATEMARLTSLAQGIWAQARANDAPGDFLPTLDEVPYPVKMEPNLVVEFYSR